MKRETYKILAAAMERVIQEETADRTGVVYGNLRYDMADAAELVYDTCLKGQSYAKNETEVTTS